jgi:hypothetical protein
MNDTDDVFAFFAIARMTGAKPAWVSVRNVFELQIVAPSGSSQEPIKSPAGPTTVSFIGGSELAGRFICLSLVEEERDCG